MPEPSLFDVYLEQWQLERDGAEIVTHASRLLPVCRDGRPLMLKVATAPEERRGGALLAAWRNGPFVPVLEQKGDAVLMQRALDDPDLAKMTLNGQDENATAVLCKVLGQIHRSAAPAGLIPLELRFKALAEAPELQELEEGRRTASELLAAPIDVCPLHGDMHHGNVLWFEEMGWLAIDPKGVLGERGFDYANILCNPDPEAAQMKGRLQARLVQISNIAQTPPERLAQWIVAWTALSAVWSMQSGDDPRGAFEIGAMAKAILRG